MAIQYRRILGNDTIGFGLNRISFGKNHAITYEEAFKLIKAKADIIGIQKFSIANKAISEMEQEYIYQVVKPVDEGFDMKKQAEALLTYHRYYTPLWFDKATFPYEDENIKRMLISDNGIHFKVWFEKKHFEDFESQQRLIILMPEHILTFWSENNSRLKRFSELKKLAEIHARKNVKYLAMKGLL